MPGVELSGNLRFRRHHDVALEALHRLNPHPPGHPRSEITVPISPDGRVDDTVLYEDPADASRLSYLPRYRLRVTPATGRYEIAMALVDGLWRITIGLESFPAPEVAHADAAILPHDLTVSVSSVGNFGRTYPVAELTPGHGDIQYRPQVVLLLSLPERDALLRAFIRDEERATLVVRRGFSVAVETAERPVRHDLSQLVAVESLNVPLLLPELVEPKPDPRIPPLFVEPPVELKPLRMPIPGWPIDKVTQPGMFVPLDLHLQSAVFPVEKQLFALNQPIIGTIAASDAKPVRWKNLFLDDRFGWKGGILSPEIDPFVQPDQPAPPQRRYVTTRADRDSTISLRFDVEAHPYLFPSGQPAASKGISTLVVPWPADGPSSRNHVYFQDRNAGNVFYYLPDVFLVGQQEEAPYGPQLSFTVGRARNDSGEEVSLAAIDAHLVPQASLSRLDAAERALAAHVPAGGGAPELRPAVHPATCQLNLPGGTIATSAPPDLVRGWWVSERFPFDALRDVYAVLTQGGASALLRGRVEVRVEDSLHQVPVELRLDRPAPPPLSWTEQPAPGNGCLVVLRNEGDQDLVLPDLPAWLTTGGRRVPATVSGGLPATLPPGSTLSLTVVPRDPTTALDDDSDVTFDLTGVRVATTPEKVVEQTLDRSVERLPRRIKLLTTQGGLGNSGDPDKDLSTIGIEFEGVASSVLLDNTTLQLDVAVPVPLMDWLLDRGQGRFRFRQTLIHLSGRIQQDTEWRSWDSNLLPLPQR